MSSRSGVDGSLPSACEAAQSLLEEGASALEAAVGGYFVAALELPGVLLAGASLLLGHSSQALLCFDGRLRQPGVGAKRPRGFRPADSIPDAARVAAPRAPQSLLIALSHFGQLRLSRVFKPALRLASRGQAPERAAVLNRAMEVGARAFQEDAFVRSIVRVASPSSGGMLTARDFELGPEMRPLPAVRGAESAVIGRYQAPWSSSACVGYCESQPDASQPHYLLAGDVWGLLVGLEFECAQRGVGVDELQLLAPLSATPVLRGVTRVPPTAPIAFEATAAIECDDQSQARRVECTHRAATHALLRDPPTRQVQLETAFGRALQRR